MVCTFLYIITIIASPTLTSAAATTMIKNTKIWASLAKVADAFATALMACILEKATNNKFTALSINSTHMKIIIALRRIKTPITPIVNNATDNAM